MTDCGFSTPHCLCPQVKLPDGGICPDQLLVAVLQQALVFSQELDVSGSGAMRTPEEIITLGYSRSRYSLSASSYGGKLGGKLGGWTEPSPLLRS